MPRARFIAWAAAAAVVALSAADAAKPRERSEDTSIEELSHQLRSGDREIALAAARSLASVGSARARQSAAALVRGLAVGVSPEVAIAALDALESLAIPTTFELIADYCHHRRSKVRIAALGTIAVLFPKRGVDYVVGALADRSQDVRGAAANIAAVRKIEEAKEPVIALLRRGAAEAVAPIGKMADADVARKVSELAAVAPDGLVANALGAILLNPAFGPDPIRVEVVYTLASLPGDDAVAALRSYIAAVPENPPRPSREEAIIAVDKRLLGGSQ